MLWLKCFNVWRKLKMEAVAKFPFRATADDELSFEKGSIVKVNGMPATVSRMIWKLWIPSDDELPSDQLHHFYLGVKYGNRSKLVQSRAKWSRWIYTEKLHRDEATRVSIPFVVSSEYPIFKLWCSRHIVAFDNMAVERCICYLKIIASITPFELGTHKAGYGLWAFVISTEKRYLLLPNTKQIGYFQNYPSDKWEVLQLLTRLRLPKNCQGNLDLCSWLSRIIISNKNCVFA